ncbi:DUF4157 domain-containing protein [Streptomyces sp. SAI-229]|uniref:eCIS core domain-containing protein n=1 Tax=Streptomyces sp. SAI-229 TaxID=3377731 RepID=UPI003C7A8053
MQTPRPRTERAGNRQPGREVSPARRETSAGASVPPPLTAVALRTAQRDAGNAAVTRMIARRVRPAPAPEQHDTGVNEVLKSGGKPLAGPVRQEMEARFRTDFSGVRLHTGPAAARSARAIGARAYTSGSHVVLGDGGGDKHTLAHELTHVVQQRQGPVSGTDHGNGLRISDPGDRFEREAEANAHRIMSGPAPVQRARECTGEHSHPVTAAPGVPHGAEAQVQRKVGFEFEVTDTNWKFRENGRLKKDTKKSLIDLPGNLAYVAADNGNVEFVTHPLATLGDVRKALLSIVAFHDKASAAGKYTEGAYEIEARGPGQAKPQATFGIGMQSVNQLVAKLETLEGQANDDSLPTKRRRVRNADDGLEREKDFKKRVTGMVPGLGQARDHAGAVLDRLAATAAEPLDASLREEVSGFLTVILKTLYDLEGKSAAGEDPKYFFSMMPRTDFVSMRGTLAPAAQAWLGSHLQGLYTALHDIADGGIDGPVFPGRYKEKPGGAALTRRQWLDSVFQGPDASDPKDLLSPPPGYPRHHETTEREGVGAMGADGPLSLFEMRDLGGPLEKESWLGLAELIARTVGEVTGDEALTEE